MTNNNNVEFGLVDWSEVKINSGNNKQFKSSADLFLRLEGGNNIIRMITEPHQYWVHKYKTNEKDPGFGFKVISCKGSGDPDPLEERDPKCRAKRRFLVGVIDRKTNAYKILDMSSDIINKIKKFVDDEEYGHPSRYDINLVVDPNGGATGYYTVVPKIPKPLSAADLEIKSNVDLEDLKRRCTPPSRQKMLERIAAIDEKSPNGKPTTSTVTETIDYTVDDSEVDFPAADGSDD
jgi:hypothetical protein